MVADSIDAMISSIPMDDVSETGLLEGRVPLEWPRKSSDARSQASALHSIPRPEPLVTEPAPQSPRIRFACPLCAETHGRDVFIAVEFDLDARFLAVADMTGCDHAEMFGLVGRLTPDQERRLIDAALTAFEVSRR